MFKKYWLFILVLSLLVLLLPSCGGSGDKTIGPSTPASGSTATPIATPTPLGPVKIGAICSWSGPAAITGLILADPIINLVEKQVKDQGGILGGRSVKVIRYDNHGSTDAAKVGVKQLVMDEKVCAITMGGSSTEIQAIAEAAEENKVLFVSMGTILKPQDYKFMVFAAFQREYNNVTIDLINNVLKPKTWAIMSDDDVTSKDDVRRVKAVVEAAGTETVYEQYLPITATDFKSNLTQINSVKPDVLYLYLVTSEQNVTLARQIMELGGLGDTKVVAFPGADAAKGLPGAQGWYVWTSWIPGLDNPGSLKFENDYKAMYGQEPTANHVYFYNSLWTAIYAIKLANTDTDLVKIAEVARSGNLVWDTPIGPAHYTADGSSGLLPIMTQIVDKQMVLVNIPK